MNDVPPPQDPTPQPSQGPLLEGDARTFVMLANLLGIFFPILAPLILWLLKKDELPAAEPQLRETLNFQITWLGGAILLPITCIGIIIAPIVYIAGVVFLILAAVSTSKGVPYTFPWKLDLVKK